MNSLIILFSHIVVHVLFTVFQSVSFFSAELRYPGDLKVENAIHKNANRSNQDDGDADFLLSHLDLNREGLQRVKNARNDPERAMKELLNYYRNREMVHHPIDRSDKLFSLGNYADQTEIEVADDALRHIFLGQPAYPRYFCGDDINWNSRPVSDMEWVWQLNRMYFWDAMARVYWHTGDERYAEEWSDQLVDWVKKNPNDDAHKYAWRSIEAGIRGHRWTGLFQHFIDSPAFTTTVLTALLRSCHDHAEYLMTKYRSKSNWGLMEAEGMAFIAMTFPEFQRAEEWKREAINRLNSEIKLQVYSDGHQRELAIGYHLGCIRWFYRTYELAELNKRESLFAEYYLGTIEKMCEVPLKIGLPDGTNAQFGDAWAGNPGQHKERFMDWAERFDRKDFLYLATEGQRGTKPNQTAYALPQSGLYSMRSSWGEEAICLVLKCGPDGGGHCQPDNGTFELFAGGRNLMPDGGSYIYSGDPEGRNWFRQTKVHQTLTLNGRNSAYDPKLLLWRPGEELDLLVVENGSYDSLIHRRAVFFIDKKYFVLVDEAYGEAAGNIDLHFQMAPGSAIFNHKDLAVVSDFRSGWNVLVKTEPIEGLVLEEEEGQVSFVYTKKMKRPAFRYRVSKGHQEHGLRFVTLVYPYLDEIQDVRVEVLGSTSPGSSEFSLKINDNGRLLKVGYNLKD